MTTDFYDFHFVFVELPHIHYFEDFSWVEVLFCYHDFAKINFFPLHYLAYFVPLSLPVAKHDYGKIVVRRQGVSFACLPRTINLVLAV